MRNRLTRSASILFLVLILSGIFAPCVFASSHVASIGSKHYKTLQAAFNAVRNGQTIKINKNIKNCYAGIDRKVRFTIDLNKHKISNKTSSGYRTLCFDKGAKVTIKNGTVKGTVEVKSKANLTVKSGTYVNPKSTCISVYYGKLTVNKGTFKGNITGQSGTILVKKGSFTAKKPFHMIGSKLTFKGGTVNAVNSSSYGNKNNSPVAFMCNLGSKVKITGGSIKSADVGLESYASYDDIVISGGTFKTKGNLFEMYNDAVLRVTGGKFTVTSKNENGRSIGGRVLQNAGNTTISGGKFTTDNTCAVYNTKNCTIKGGTFTTRCTAADVNSINYALYSPGTLNISSSVSINAANGFTEFGSHISHT